MNKLTPILGLAITAAILIAAIFLSGSFIYFLDIPSLIMVLGITTAMLCTCFGLSTVKSAICNPLFSRKEPDPAKLNRQLNALKFGYTIAWAAGITATIIQLILILQNMDDPSKIGPGIAFAMLAIFYAAIIAEFISNPLRQITININPDTLTQLQNDPTVPPKSMAPKAIGTIMLVLFVFAYSLLANSQYIEEQQYHEVIDAIQHHNF